MEKEGAAGWGLPPQRLQLTKRERKKQKGGEEELPINT